MESNPAPTAALLIIGNEVLSGRTKDANLSHLGTQLSEMGIRMMEARVVPDIEARIIEAVNELRARYTYVFTTGGIGPTHDDITSACIAKAFGVKLIRHPDAMTLLAAHYAATGAEFNDARKKMAEVPEGAALVENPVSKAPGFHIGNVYVFAGIPRIMQAMFDSVRGELATGAKIASRTVSCRIGEGTLAQGLGAIQARHPSIDIGSYPYFAGGGFGVSLVLRGTDEAALDAAADEVRALIRSLGGEPVEGEPVKEEAGK
ncbi:competence/damage-inducible protein A [Oceanibaculum indicum]|uniref:Molybdenum cofactor synthesis domain-containing protein n=1 Tax=Oceanibaculum indicum TaxID=526216 RepID=A0A420WN93_9PROT|nr:molybdopterin-binding protein [Oceanibaculum indicum]RKQ72504.1 molybdenum cofactor synthesis domain-containing protein [Oceanibaculum indicum]